jgi:hypothetical protein
MPRYQVRTPLSPAYTQIQPSRSESSGIRCTAQPSQTQNTSFFQASSPSLHTVELSMRILNVLLGLSFGHQEF